MLFEEKILVDRNRICYIIEFTHNINIRNKPMKILQVLLLFLLLVLFVVFPSLNAKVFSSEPEPGTSLIEHTVGRGEDLHLLAGYYLLNARDWRKIYNWNSDVIKRRNFIYPGQVLRIYVDKDWSPPYDLKAFVNEMMKVGGR